MIEAITVEEVGAIAVEISEKLPEPLEAHEQAFFIAGFQEAVKYLWSNDKDYATDFRHGKRCVLSAGRKDETGNA